MKSVIKMGRPSTNVVSLSLPTPFPIGDVNVYLIEGNPLTLVDTGVNTEESWEALNKGIEAAGYRLKDIKQLVLTHFHEDHAGLAARIKAETDAVILAHPDTAVWLKNENWFEEWRNDFFEQLYLRAGLNKGLFDKLLSGYNGIRSFGCTCSIDMTLNHGDALPGHPEWQVVYTPGHSQSQFSLYRDTDQTMLLADHLISHSAATAFIEPPVRLGGQAVKALLQYRDELHKLRKVPIRVGLSGHGDPILDHVSLIERRLQSLERRADTVIELLAGEEKTAVELAFELFPNHRGALPMIMSETLGHLECLEADGRVARETRDGVDRYFIQS